MTFKLESIPFYKALDLFEQEKYQEAFALFYDAYLKGNLIAPYYLRYMLKTMSTTLVLNDEQSKSLKTLEELIDSIPKDYKLDAWCQASTLKIKLNKTNDPQKRTNLLAELQRLKTHAPNALVFLYFHYGLDTTTNKILMESAETAQLLKAILGQADLYILYYLKNEFKKYQILILGEGGKGQNTPEFIFKNELKECAELDNLEKLSQSGSVGLIETMLSRYYNGSEEVFPQQKNFCGDHIVRAKLSKSPFEKDLVRKLKWQYRAAYHGNRDIQLMFSIAEKQDQHLFQSHFWLSQAACNGENQAQMEYGFNVYYGCGNIKQDFHKARLLLEKGLAGTIGPKDVANPRGFATANVLLGFMHERGLGGVEKSDLNAIAYYKKAHELGDPSATYNLGYMVQRGRHGEKPNSQQAIDYYQQCLALLAPGANYNPQKMSADTIKLIISCYSAMAEIYHFGRNGFKEDFEKAYLYHQKAGALGDIPSQYYTSVLQFHGNGTRKDEHTALLSLSELAEKGDIPSGLFLGSIFPSSQRDWKAYKLTPEKIEHYLLQCLKEEHYKEDFDIAHSALGMLYYRELKTPENLKKAYECFLKGEALEQDESLLFLGDMYEHGCKDINIPQDYKKAYEYYERASKNGNRCALNNMGYFQASGFMGEKNNLAGKLFYEQALEKGMSLSAYGLYCLYRTGGSGIEKDPKKAFEYLQQALKSQDSDVYFAMATELYKGEITAFDLETSMKYYKLAALQGNTKAAHNYAIHRLNWVMNQSSLSNKELEEIVQLLEVPAKAGYSADIFYKNMITLLIDPSSKDKVIAELKAAVSHKPYRRSSRAIEFLSTAKKIFLTDILVLLMTNSNLEFYKEFNNIRSHTIKKVFLEAQAKKAPDLQPIVAEVSKSDHSKDEATKELDPNQENLEKFKKLQDSIDWFKEQGNQKRINIHSFKQLFGHLMKFEDLDVEVIPSKSSGTRFKVTTLNEEGKPKSLCFSYHPRHRSGSGSDSDFDPKRSRSLQNFVKDLGKQILPLKQKT